MPAMMDHRTSTMSDLDRWTVVVARPRPRRTARAAVGRRGRQPVPPPRPERVLAGKLALMTMAARLQAARLG
jgi:hypothetical protein